MFLPITKHFFKRFALFGSACLVQPSKVVKVHASLLLKDSLEVHLNNATRVADVLKQFQKNLCQNGWNIVNTVNFLKWQVAFSLLIKNM